jgi:hypothetical protein
VNFKKGVVEQTGIRSTGGMVGRPSVCKEHSSLFSKREENQNNRNFIGENDTPRPGCRLIKKHWR